MMFGVPCVVLPMLPLYGVSMLILMGSGSTLQEILRDLALQAQHCAAGTGGD